MEKILLSIVVLLSTLLTTTAFLLEPDPATEPHCVWYGQCGEGHNGGKLNCPMEQKAPKLTDPTALRILKSYCPSLYHGDNNTYTCCHPDQLVTIQKSISLPKSLLTSCPSCLYNFIDNICQLTCSPQQSKFMWANMSAPYSTSNTQHSGIPEVSVVVSKTFAQDFYDSCVDKEAFFGIKAISLLCGRASATCTPENWLKYMGSYSNGQAPFTINYILADSWIPPTWTHVGLQPLNLHAARCDAAPPFTTSVYGSHECKCRDCKALKPCGQHDPLPRDSDRRHYLDNQYGLNKYATVTLKIEPTEKAQWVDHQFPPPAVDSLMLAPIFGLDFLKNTLTLQEHIYNLTAGTDGSSVTFNDLCVTPQGQSECVMESILQYYQNSISNLEKEVYDEYNIFMLANYLDHFISCSHYPTLPLDGTKLNMSCQADFGAPVEPFMVMDGYLEDDFQNATGLVLTYVVKYTPDGDNAQVQAWANAVDQFVQSFSSPDMTVTYSWYHPSTHARAVGGVESLADLSDISVVQPLSGTISSLAAAQPNIGKPVPILQSIGDYEDESDAGPGYNVVSDAAADQTSQEDVLEDEAQGHCVWYGQCGKGWNSGRLNCPVTNKTRNAPLLTDPKGLEILKKYCPGLYHGDNNTRTCCDVNQLTTFADNLALPEQFLARCPACYHNFLNQICQMTCSPHHSLFLYANMTAPQPPNTLANNTGIPSVTYVMTPKFAKDMFTSCKDVQMPSANDKAISVFCGRKAEKCTPFIWLSYMGGTGNGRAPFPILYDFTNTTVIFNNVTMYPMNITNVHCNESFSNTTEACSCQDCAASCAPIPPPPPPKEPFKILHIDGPAFICSCIFAAFVIFFGTYVFCFSIVKRDGFVQDGVSQEYDPDCCETPSRASSQQNLVGKGIIQVSPADISCLEKLGANVEHLLCRGFTVWGTFCAKYPLIILLISLIVFGSLAGGIARYDVTTDPVKLWAAKTSTTRMQKDYFDSHFGPFYRTEQIIISRPNNHTKINHPYPPPSVNSINFSSLFDLDFMHQVLDLQESVENIQVEYEGKNVTLQDICFKPMAPDYNDCTIESVLQFWQNNRTNLDKVIYDQYHIFDYADHFDHFLACVQAPASVSDGTKLGMSCLGAYGGPAFPWVVMGGFDGKNYQNATAFVITFVVNNHLDEKKNGMAEAWEAEFIKLMKNYKNDKMTVSFSSERSIQDELDRESSSDIWTIVVSYLIMFAYITFTLGQFQSVNTIFIDSKITLGLSGVTIVLLSVAASVGFYSYANVPMTLIIIEVVPFLVLAVGVDNIFILVQTFQRDERRGSETLEEQIGRLLGQVGPSMLLTSFSESIAFFLGALTDMPAVREFALYAAMAVFFDFLLQITCFISLMTLDAKRQESNRFDICCCINMKQKEKQTKSKGYLYWLINNYYSPFVLSEVVRPLVILTFVGWFLASIALALHIEVGLDQALSMPTDSYVLDYFHNLSTFLSVGAPVYFVVPNGFNYLNRTSQNELCGSKGCNQDSLIGQVYQASLLPQYSYIAQPASSWMDDYFDWINSAGSIPCCRLNSTGGFCPSTSKENCTNCPFEPQIGGRPTSHDFIKYLPMFLSDNPGLICAKGGHPAYGAGVNLINNKTSVGASYFMTYHTIMKTSPDYINGLKEARAIARNISKALNVLDTDEEVFPYSIFYVFYEQYLMIVEDTIKNIGICIAAIFVVTFILLGFDIVSATLVCLTIMMIIMDIMGMMYMWDINLNALSLVNLVMAIGISVEFCSHIARAFAVSIEKNRILRAQDALAHMGSSVLSGITLTKLGGIVVLAFAKSQLFQVFYFRMYLGMVVFGASHGLLFLPVLLSYIGPSINKAKLYQAHQGNTRNTSHMTANNDYKPDSYRPSNAHL